MRNSILKATEIACPDKQQTFANISLSRNTTAEKINDLVENLNSQIQVKVKSFAAFSFATEESTDVSDISQHAVFISRVDKNRCIAKELLELVLMRHKSKTFDGSSE